MNRLIREAVQAALARLPAGRGVRILEIGAGTGGTTAAILPALPPHRTEYVFTNVSPLFTTHGEAEVRLLSVRDLPAARHRAFARVSEV